MKTNGFYLNIMELLPPPTVRPEIISFNDSSYIFSINKLQDKEGISIKLTEEKPKNNIYYEYIAEKDKLVKDIKVLFICKSIDEMIKTLKESFNKGNVTVDNINNKYIMELEFKGFGVITKSVIELELP